MAGKSPTQPTNKDKSSLGTQFRMNSSFIAETLSRRLPWDMWALTLGGQLPILCPKGKRSSTSDWECETRRSVMARGYWVTRHRTIRCR